ncbi:MAG: hypothetical protein IJX52_07645, partial [Oscillibacter sp.]|nr:hypothetical protein [Oscillibacter sp.]
HSMPVIVSYGFSSARGASEEGVPPRTERQQGENIVAVWNDAVEAGITGVSLSAWQDAWGHSSWNTAFAMDMGNSRLWHDLQSDGQNLGLLAFEPGEEPVCILDGDPGEWSGDTPVLESGGISLYIRSDQEGLYLLLAGEGVGPEKPIYLPLDVAEELGSTYCSAPALTFDRAADFLLCLEGEENSRLLVQERYDAMRMNFNYAQGGSDPFVDVPENGGGNFVTVSMAVYDPALIDTASALFTAEELRQLQALGAWETGMLVHGSSDSADPAYNSLADFCYGQDCVELRLPWLLLNVADPVDMEVHRDYYTCYGVETRRLTACWIGLGDGSEDISMYSFKPEPLERKPAWRERLKESYYVVREHWT